MISGTRNEAEEIVSQYQLRSCSDLRHAITRGDYFEVFCSSLYVIDSSLLILGPGLRVVMRTLVHLSGVWAVMKQLYVDPSTAVAQWILYEWHFTDRLIVVRNFIASEFRWDTPPNSYIAKIGEFMTSILSELLNWPIHLLPRVDYLDQIIRYRRLSLALYFRCLDLRPGRQFLDFDVTSKMLRSLTSTDMRIAFGIEELLRNLEGVDFPPLQIGLQTLETRISYRVCGHLVYKIHELSLSSDDSMTEIINICYQLIAVFSNTCWFPGPALLQADILFFTGLFLTTSRHPTGICYILNQIY